MTTTITATETGSATMGVQWVGGLDGYGDGDGHGDGTGPGDGDWICWDVGQLTAGDGGPPANNNAK